ncbi:MAP7 domain-containing protein 3 isoform X1 [Bufo gargarizans]|uniref:MAP7 domain-containing protein 3 isoform X1 n=1 Tax=Bufo gargarizans TaxID=30331 RepID=UPI001CF55631|nr:MAP7 domain-containing protein 3 isoform X1 [Bufo gargarizans]
MADGSGKLKGLRDQMVAAAQAMADERRSQTGSSPVPVPSSVSVKTAKPVIDGSALRTDERQRLARERREERERLNAAKEKELLEKEKKAKLQYEKQMEEKQKKLEEQKLKDEQKRVAAEEKRKQRLLEDKERREANVRRTLERSSYLDQRQKRWSWGGSAEEDKHGASGSSSPSQVDLIGRNASTTEPQLEDESGSGAANVRSTSTSNLRQADGSIHKRLSSSSATLEKGTKQRSSSLSRLSNKTPLSPQPFSPKVSNPEQKGGTGQKRSSSLSRLSSKKSPPAHLEGAKKEEKTAHRPPSSPLDSSLINRLLAPTQSSLARSKSAATLSADGKELPESHLCPRSASATTTSTPPSVSKGPMRSRSIDRAKTPSTAASCSATSEVSQKSGLDKPLPSVGKRPPSPSVTSRRRSPSPAGVTKQAPSPTLEKRNSSSITQRTRPPSPSLTKQRPPSPTVTQKPAPIQRPLLTPSVLSTTKKTAEPETKPKEKCTDMTSSEPKTPQTSEKEAASSKTKDESSNKTISGSTTPEEAAKILAQNRRLAREQREREEQERIQRQEEERIKQEEMARKAEEERLRLEEETKLLEEKRRLEREEEQRLAEEEKIRRDQEEQERLVELQQQREEAEAKALEEAEKQKQEREKIMQQNMQERLQRKKRIEEIMKRTRKNEQNDVKSEDRSEDDEDTCDVENNQQGSVSEDDLCEDADTPCEMGEETASQDLLSQKAALVEKEELFINGDQPDTVEKINGHSSDTAPPLESSQATEDKAVVSQDEMHLNDDNTCDTVPKLNGKPATWTFEEIIDLGIHSKPSNLSDSIAMDGCDQGLIEAATIPPKLAFEEGQMNSL